MEVTENIEVFTLSTNTPNITNIGQEDLYIVQKLQLHEKFLSCV